MTAATGWRLVPVEATEEMLSAMFDRLDDGRLGEDYATRDVWNAAIAAAPQPGVAAEDIATLKRIIGIEYYAGSDEFARTLERILSLISSNSTQKEQGA